MSVTLSDLIADLTENIPARNGVPSAAQYERAVKTAVMDFSRRCSREAITTLDIISGQASYDMPADFVSMIRLYLPFVIGDVMITPAGLVPLNGRSVDSQYKMTFANGKMTLTPTPTSSLSYYMSYASGWALDEQSQYASMTEMEAAIVLIKAEAECLTLQLNAEGGGVLAYRIGDESFDKSGGINAMIGQRDMRLGAYKDACASYNGFTALYGGN